MLREIIKIHFGSVSVTEHNIVMTFLSICLFNAGMVPKGMDVSSNFLDILLGRHSSFYEPHCR